jgi:hypothetical protein
MSQSEAPAPVRWYLRRVYRHTEAPRAQRQESDGLHHHHGRGEELESRELLTTSKDVAAVTIIPTPVPGITAPPQFQSTQPGPSMQALQSQTVPAEAIISLGCWCSGESSFHRYHEHGQGDEDLLWHTPPYQLC